jgi:hypothetical protein
MESMARNVFYQWINKLYNDNKPNIGLNYLSYYLKERTEDRRKNLKTEIEKIKNPNARLIEDIQNYKLPL